jgi:hypothetical protein
MDWGYVAGYFDGEGHVSMHATKKGIRTRALAWYNSHLPSLEAMQAFMGAGHIVARTRGKKKPVYTLTVGRRADLVRVLEAMIPHLLVKREAAEALLLNLDGVGDLSENFGKVAAVSSEQLLRWYHDEGKSYTDIAKDLGVSPSAIAQAFRVRGLPRRPAGGDRMKGVPKSDETRRRMVETRRRLWSDPEFRAAQLAHMARSWEKRRAKK